MEKRIELVPYRVYKYCDDCKERGKLLFNGKTLPSNPPRYVHECPICKKEYNLRTTYPAVVYEEKG